MRGEGDRDYKTILQELASQELRALPEYAIEERGPDHQKEFTATVFLAGERSGSGTGRSKKEAEQQAAREAYARLAERRGDARPVRGGRGMELPEVEVMRRDLEKDVVGRRIKEVEVKGSQERHARHPPPQDPQGVHVAPGRPQDREGRAPRASTSCCTSTAATCWSCTSA